MKISTNIKLIFCALFILTGINSNGQGYEWARKSGLWAYDYAFGVGADAAGNVYITGKYEMDAEFEGGSTVTCEGNHDIYLAKYNATGTFQWVKTAGSVFGDYAHALSVDADGNCYITGEFEMDANFDSTTLSTWGSNDIFVAKYNTNGDLLWARRAGGTRSDQGLAISVSNGNVYIAGKFKDTCFFETSNITLISNGDDDFFVAKYDTDGNLAWATSGGSPDEDETFGIATDNSGNSYITGHFYSTTNISSATLTSDGLGDIFIAKYDNSGNLQWAKRAGGEFDDEGNSVAVDNSGLIYVTGRFRVNSNFDHLSMWASLGDADIFIACYNNSGNVQWIQKAGGDKNDFANAITLDAFSNIYITGSFAETAVFSGTTLTAADSADIYIASYTPSGSLRWILHPGGSHDGNYLVGTEEAGYAIAIDGAGKVLVGGGFRKDVNFGGTLMTGWTNTDSFVTKIDPLSTSVAEVALESEFNLFPNPSQSYFNLTGKIGKSKSGSATFEIIDVLGRIVYIRPIIINDEHVNERILLPTDLSEGTYQIKIYSDEESVNKRFILKK